MMELSSLLVTALQGLACVLLVVAALILAFYLYVTWTHGLFKKLGVPGPSPTFMGVLPLYASQGIAALDEELVQKYGRIVGFFHGRQPCLLVSDPDVIKQIFVKEFSKFINRIKFLPSSPELRYAVADALDDNWKFQRSVISPTFSTGRLREMVPLLQNCVDKLVAHLREVSKEGASIDISKAAPPYAMDALACTLFGVDADTLAQPDNDFARYARRTTTFSFSTPLITISLLCPAVIPFLERLNLCRLDKDTRSFFSRLVQEAIAERKKEGSTRRDFLHLALGAHQLQGDEEEHAEAKVNFCQFRTRSLNAEEITSNAVFFITAGYDTSSIALAFCLHCLATHPEVQQRLVVEINQHIADNPLTYENVMGLKYLDMVVSETLRLYPPAQRLNRRMSEDATIKGFKIPKDVQILFPTIVIHRDPEFWNEPLKFDPERFTPVNRAKWNPYCYQPFGLGPRNCVGMRLALLEIKMAVVAVVQNFRLMRTEETETLPKLGKLGFTRAEKGLPLRLVPRFTDY